MAEKRKTAKERIAELEKERDEAVKRCSEVTAERDSIQKELSSLKTTIEYEKGMLFASGSVHVTLSISEEQLEWLKKVSTEYAKEDDSRWNYVDEINHAVLNYVEAGMKKKRKRKKSQNSNAASVDFETEKKLLDLYKENNQLRENLSLLKSQILIYENKQREEKKHNQRGAGRKKGDAKFIAGYDTFCVAYESGKTMAEIMKECGISRSTYFRHKRLYEDTKEIF